MCLSLPYISIQTTFPFEVLNLTLMSLLFCLTLYICSKATFPLSKVEKSMNLIKSLKYSVKWCWRYVSLSQQIFPSTLSTLTFTAFSQRLRLHLATLSREMAQSEQRLTVLTLTPSGKDNLYKAHPACSH